jgi:hypothetical protein
MERFGVALSLVLSTGCITHLRPVGHDYLRVNWAPNFEAAQARATEERKPLLVCLVSGELDGPC